jgi:hypothetical protein
MSSIIKVNTVQDTDGNNIINENANTITIGASGDTISIPSGATLANNGTATGFATIDWQSSIVTAATLTAVAGRGYWIDTSSNACTVTFPAAASVGDQIILTDYARNWATNAVTINQNSLKFQGFTSPNPIYNTNGQSIDLVYSGTTKGWIPNSDDDVAFKNPPYDAEYFALAGGGGGGYGNAGGGGAGGIVTNFGGTAISLTAGAVYTITVGGGGAGGGSGPSTLPGSKGGNSVISGTGITTVTAEGGGFGAAGSGGTDGGAGGSGGGGEYGGSGAGGPGSGGAAGAGQIGNAGGAGAPSLPGTPGAYGGGGGGGAGQAGGAGSQPSAGYGGNGTPNSITGSAVVYAGGGGGSSDPAFAAGDGGTGGGGDGAQHSAPGRNATSGTDGLGGGGGAGINSRAAGTGGDGVVILRVASSDYSGTTTGSPTVTTTGSDTVIKFTASGSYTA